MAVTKTLNIAAPIIGKIAAASYTTVQTTGSTWFDMGQFEQVRFVLNAGTFGGSATLDATVLQGTTATGTSSKALSPAKAIVQATAGGTFEIIVKAVDLDVNAGFRYVQFSATPATAAVVFGAVVEGADVRTSPQTTTATQTIL